MAWDDLPEGWELTSLARIAQDTKTGFACSAREEEGLPDLRPNNIGTDGQLELTLVKRVLFEAGDLSKYDLKPGMRCSTTQTARNWLARLPSLTLRGLTLSAIT